VTGTFEDMIELGGEMHTSLGRSDTYVVSFSQ